MPRPVARDGEEDPEEVLREWEGVQLGITKFEVKR
jgi:hypothetical protein